MAKNIINITEGLHLAKIKICLEANGEKMDKNEDAVNRIIVLLSEAMKASDEETHMALFGLKKEF